MVHTVDDAMEQHDKVGDSSSSSSIMDTCNAGPVEEDQMYNNRSNHHPPSNISLLLCGTVVGPTRSSFQNHKFFFYETPTHLKMDEDSLNREF